MSRRRGFETGQLCGFRIKSPISGRDFAGQRKTKISQGVPKSLFVSKRYGWAIRLRVGGASLSPHSLSPRGLAQLIQRFQPFRHHHDCSGCFRRQRSPGGTCTHRKSAALLRPTPISEINNSPLSPLCGNGKIKKTTTNMIYIKDPGSDL